MQKYLFVGGVARSGTSALCEMLNYHPEVAIGMERYKSYASNGELFVRGEMLFEKEKFFDYQTEETNILLDDGKYKNLYKRMQGKYHKATYIGDKVPTYYRHVKKLSESFSGAKFIFIWRPLAEVAMSWERRTKDASTWPAHNGIEAAVEEWVKGMKIIIRQKQKYKGAVMLINYDQLFKVDDPSPVRLLKWLGLEMTDEYLKGVIALRKKALSIATSREEINPIALELADRSNQNQFIEELRSLSL